MKKTTIRYGLRNSSFGNYLRKSTALLLNFLLNHQTVFKLAGWLNRRLHFLSSIFLVYPASKEHALTYTFAWQLLGMQWKPNLIGLFRQEGQLGIMFCISSTESDSP